MPHKIYLSCYVHYPYYKFELGDIITKHAQAMPDKYKNSDVTVAYKKYLVDKYIDWTNRPIPIKVRWNKGCTPSWYKS